MKRKISTTPENFIPPSSSKTKNSSGFDDGSLVVIPVATSSRRSSRSVWGSFDTKVNKGIPLTELSRFDNGWCHISANEGQIAKLDEMALGRPVFISQPYYHYGNGFDDPLAWLDRPLHRMSESNEKILGRRLKFSV